MLRRLRNHILISLLTLAEALLKALFLLLSPVLFLAEIVESGLPTVIRRRIARHARFIRRFELFLKRTFIGRYILSPILLVLLTLAEVLIRVIFILYWPILFVVEKFERYMSKRYRPCNWKELPPAVRYQFWMTWREFGDR